MTYTVIEPIKVRTRQGITELKTGQNVNLTAGIAEDLIRRGKVKPGGGIPYKIIFSPEVNDCFLVTDTDVEAEALRSTGILDVVYSHPEIKLLRGKSVDELKAIHAVKKAFLRSTIERSIQQ